MPAIKRSNADAFKVLADGLKALDGKQARAGWLETAYYPDGTPIAYIAAVQEFGATISHPGGTPYTVGPDGARFVSKENGAGLPVTKAHTIVIPPRPFLRPTIADERNNWLKIMADGAKRVMRGKGNAAQVLETVASKAAFDVYKTISKLTSPPLKLATIAARLRKKSNKKLVGALDKPLVDTGEMIKNIQWTVEDAS